jgi:hypothetical protein
MFPGPPSDYPPDPFHGSRGCYRTFDAGPGIRSLDLYVDDSQGDDGVLRVLHADLVPLPGEE